MKRHIKDVKSTGADTPLPTCLGKKCRQEEKCSLNGFGTPVEGLTGMPVDTPESQQRQRAIPDTTQRKLEGFCLNTPLTLSQAQAAETPTLGDNNAKEKAAAEQQGQQQQNQQPAASNGTRHRLANISNLPPQVANLAAGAAAAAAAADSPCCICHSEQLPDCCCDMPITQAKQMPSWHKQQQQQASTGSKPQQVQRKRHMHVSFSARAGLLSPPATLAGPQDPSDPLQQQQQFPSQQLSQAPWSAVAAAAAAAACPGSAGPSEDGFVLHTSQNYSRASQPAISPSVAAGLSAAPEEEQEQEQEEAEAEVEEPFTTPSQDSREPPQQSPSNITGISNTTSSNATTAFGQPPAPVLAFAAACKAGCRSRRPLAAAAAAATAGSADLAGGPSRFDSNTSSDDVFVLPAAPSGAAAFPAAVALAATPGDSLALLLGEDLEETTTPELEQIGLASQEGGSQFSAGGAAAAAAAAVGGAGGGGSRGSNFRGGAAAAAGASGSGRAAGVVLEEVTTKQVLFPIFRPKSTRKCIILVRHGESTYNKQDAHGKNWVDPQIFDAPLTQRGRLQAVGAREAVQRQLDKWGHLGSVLWLSSPLTRALETMTLACPDVEQLAKQQVQQQQQQGGGGRVVILSTISEHCVTSGDVGLPASQLRERWPSFASQLNELQEHWWYNPEPLRQPNCAMRRVFARSERLDDMRHRVSEFTRWLGSQPEQVVVAFGHSTFWKYFTNSKTRMKNCEVRQMMW